MVFYEAFSDLMFAARVQAAERDIKARDFENLAIVDFVALPVYRRYQAGAELEKNGLAERMRLLNS